MAGRRSVPALVERHRLAARLGATHLVLVKSAALPVGPATAAALASQTAAAEREARMRRPAVVGTARGAAMADMTSQDMAGKLLAAGFERSGPGVGAVARTEPPRVCRRLSNL